MIWGNTAFPDRFHQPVNLRVFVTETNRFLLVDGVKHGRALFGKLLPVVNRLSAAADAAARTGHNLHKVILRFAALNRRNQLAHVAQPVNHRRAHHSAADVKLRFFPRLHAAHLAEHIRAGVFARHQFEGRAQRRFHHAAGRAEDHACTRVFPQRRIVFALRHGARIDGLRANHARQLTRGQHVIHVLPCARAVHARPCAFVLLRHARHDRHTADFRRIDAHFLREIGLGDRAEHLLGDLQVEMLPSSSGACVLTKRIQPGQHAGEHRHRRAARMGETLDELRALLHDREVSREIRVKNIFHAHMTQNASPAAFPSRLPAAGRIARPMPRARRAQPAPPSPCPDCAALRVPCPYRRAHEAPPPGNA